MEDFLAPDRVVVGDNGGWAGDAVVELYRPLLPPARRPAGRWCVPTSPPRRW